MSTNRILIFWICCAVAQAAELTVVVNGVKDEKGFVGCALIRSPEGFPMEAAKASTTRVPAKPGAVECKFERMEAGSYAVAVSVDRNSNGKTDKNMFGIPTEPWGVSNNVRPGMRPPRFAEAAFGVRDGESKQIEIKVAQ